MKSFSVFLCALGVVILSALITWTAEGSGIQSGISGPAGGDLSGNYPNPTVVNGSHITNASIQNSGLLNASTTVNGIPCTLGSTCSIATGGGSGLTPAPGQLPPISSAASKIRTALAKTRDGVADTKILFIGDSITAGNGSTLTSTFPTYGAFPSRVVIGSSTIQASPTMGLFPGITDHRFTLGTGWSSYGGFGFGTSSAYLGNVAGGTLSYTPGTQNGSYNTYDLYYLQYSGGGDFSAVATGGSDSGTILTNGSLSVQKITISAAAAGTANSVVVTTGAGTIFILGIESYLSASKTVRIANAGIVSTTASGNANGSWSFAGGGNALDAVSKYAPDLCVIELGTNDALILAATKATFKSALDAIIKNCQLSGDVVLMTSPPTSDSTVEALMVQYFAAMNELAVSDGTMLLDIYGRFGSAFATALMNDAYHPNNLGYWDIGAAVSNFIRIIVSLN